MDKNIRPENGWMDILGNIAACDWYSRRPFDQAHAFLDLLLAASRCDSALWQESTNVTELAARWGRSRWTVMRWLKQFDMHHLMHHTMHHETKGTSILITIANKATPRKDAPPHAPSHAPSSVATVPAPAKQKAASFIDSIPEKLQTETFLKTWLDWEAARREQKKRLTPRAAAEQLALLVQYSEPEAIEMIRASIRNNWQGIFPLKNQLRRTVEEKGGYVPRH